MIPSGLDQRTKLERQWRVKLKSYNLENASLKFFSSGLFLVKKGNTNIMEQIHSFVNKKSTDDYKKFFSRKKIPHSEGELPKINLSKTPTKMRKLNYTSNFVQIKKFPSTRFKTQNITESNFSSEEIQLHDYYPKDKHKKPVIKPGISYFIREKSKAKKKPQNNVELPSITAYSLMNSMEDSGEELREYVKKLNN